MAELLDHDLGSRAGDSLVRRLFEARRSSHLTSAETPASTGESPRTVQSTGRATMSAKRSGALKAAVFGSTSANTTTKTVITTVA